MKKEVKCHCCGRTIEDKRSTAKYCANCWKHLEKTYNHAYNVGRYSSIKTEKSWKKIME
jgi:protein-arginine kinase activator protein McsA